MNKLSIGVMVTASKKKYADQIQACLDTWVKDANKNNIPVYLFAGYHRDNRFDLINLPNVQEDYQSAFDKHFQGLKWMYDNNPSQYYLILGTDTYINITNLLPILEDNLGRVCIGGHTHEQFLDKEKLIYFHGGCGLIFSHELLSTLFNIYTTEQIRNLWNKVCNRNNRKDLLTACDVMTGWLCNLFNFTMIKNNNFYGCNNYTRIENYIICNNNCNDILYTPEKIIGCHFMEPPLMMFFDQCIKYSCDNKINNWTILTTLNDVSDTIINFINRLPFDKIIYPQKYNYIDMITYFNDNNNYTNKYVMIINPKIFAQVGLYQYQLINIALQYRNKTSCAITDYPVNNTNTNFITSHIDQLSSDLNNIEYYYAMTGSELLINYDNIRVNPDNICSIVFKSRAANDFKTCIDCCSKLIDAILSDKLNIKLELLVKVLDDYFISLYYTNIISIAEDILNLHNKFWQNYGDEYLSQFKLMAKHIVANSDCLAYVKSYKNITFITSESDIITDGKYCIYGDYELSPKCLIINNVIYRPNHLKLNV